MTIIGIDRGTIKPKGIKKLEHMTIVKTTGTGSKAVGESKRDISILRRMFNNTLQLCAFIHSEAKFISESRIVLYGSKPVRS